MPSKAVLDADDLCARSRGLTEAEAVRRLEQYGPNAISQARSRGVGEIVRATLREPMFLLLLAAAGLYLVLGDLGEGLFLLAGAAASIGLVVFQEARSERALAALRELAEPSARVIRDGVERRIPARELVPGDLLLIGEGERLPVDAALISGGVLTVDESALTGESVPVTKRPAENTIATGGDPEPGGDDSPFLFAGTLIVRGQGVATVLRTGLATRLGRIGASLATIESEPTLLQKTTGALIAKLGILSFAFCGLVVVAYGLLRRDWIEGTLAGLTLAISLLPEEFPMVLAIFLSLGSWRLARHKVLVRRAAVVETLGATSMLCVDKTGTLTENRMTVAALWREGVATEIKGALPTDAGAAELIRVAALASAVRPVDPMDRAIRKLAPSAEDEGPLRTYPLRPELLAFIQVWAQPGGDALIAAKGAPEAVFRLCRLNSTAQAELESVVGGLAGQGLRVLGVASRRQDNDGPDEPATLQFVFEGLVGFMDRVRDDVPQALAEARRAGIQVAMITGDYPATAREIAGQAGIDTSAGMLTGKEISTLDKDTLRQRARQIRVYARVMPEQKLSLVEAFKANGHVVAMTGDGVNDAPALEAAHIGIAMGQRGTDVAREAADIVLLDDRFASIVGGVRLGRRIFANLRKALTYIVAIHVPVAGLALLPILLGLPPILFPMHVVLLELVVDPVCSLVFEGEPSERRAMEKPPRPAGESLFGAAQIALGLLQGAVVLASVFGLYLWALDTEIEEAQARALAFTALIVGNLVLALADSAETGTSFFDRRRLVFWVIGATAALVIAAIVYVPPLAGIFRVAPPDFGIMILAIIVATAAGGWFGLVKRLRGG